MKGINKLLYCTALGVGLVGLVTSMPTLAASEADNKPVVQATPHYAAQMPKPLPAPEGGMQAERVPGSSPLLDLNAKEWELVKPITVPMQPQTVALPNNAKPAVSEMFVRSVHNGHYLSVLLEWKDALKNDRLVVDNFGDQVAVQLPINFRGDNQPNPMMGAADEQVNIIQWRAVFQADLDRKRDITIHDIYPNAANDIYPDQILNATDARSYLGAVGLDNPLAKHRDSPVLDQVAEGYGSLSIKLHQEADGHGEWKDGMWRVVITTPLAAKGANAPRLIPGENTVMAFAVWDGAAQEVGARKAWSDWVPLKLAK